ncbi:type II toxin-antitoxin system HicB family antitoxin [Methyloligella solikamskensis]|uniref:Type II toxin-antitoxin system HicB family antitoxin n=1 Tax=Methyloligella solikamskensis TaxID=1177756 RepID=A0ABW3J6W7_9HYPH
MTDYHWPCHVSQDEDGSYRVSPAGMAGCDGTGKTQEEAEARARQALQHFLLSSDEEALLAIGVYQHGDIESALTGEMIRLKVDLPD